MGAEVILVGPELLLPDSYARPGVRIERELDAIVSKVDAIVLLRIQRERFDSAAMSDAEYIERYQLSAPRLERMNKRTIVMHPGPYNRGVELDDSVLDHARWLYARQVRNGVFVRMAVLDFLVNGRH
jgi:aspartate carbamoyltransferase catalytic subunit